jgi:ketosteroid isomerase-like protein
MTEQENLQIARRVFEAWNAHAPNRYTALLDPGHVWETDTLPQTVRGRDAARQTMQMYLGASPISTSTSSRCSRAGTTSSPGGGPQ